MTEPPANDVAVNAAPVGRSLVSPLIFAVLLIPTLSMQAAAAQSAPARQESPSTSPAELKPLLSTPLEALAATTDSLDNNPNSVTTIGGETVTQDESRDRREELSGPLPAAGLTLATDTTGSGASSRQSPSPPAGSVGTATPVPTEIARDPAGAMGAMADALDKQGATAVMEVEGKKITFGEIADTIREMPISMASVGYAGLYRYAAHQVIREKVLLAAAEKAGIEDDPVIRRRQASRAGLVLAQEWLDRTAAAKVTEAAVHARYDRDIAGRPGPEEVRARVILVATDVEARALIKRLEQGEDFALLARQNSIDASAVAGGDTGFIRVEGLGAEVGAVMFALEPGEITAFPVHAAPGYFIIRVEARRQTAPPTFDQVRAELARTLRREAGDALMKSMVDAAVVTQLSPAPNDH